MLLREAKVVYTSSRRVDCKRKITCAADAWLILQNHGLPNEAQECFVVLHLNGRNEVLCVQEVGRGSLTGVEAHPREVFRGAILNGSRAIILAHNHPSGDVTPSIDDWALTQRMVQVGKLVDIPVLDHVVVTDHSFLSLLEANTDIFA